MEKEKVEQLFEEDYVDQMLDDKIKKINYHHNVYEVGKVIQVKDFIIYANGLENISFYEKAYSWRDYFKWNGIKFVFLRSQSTLKTE